MSKVSRAKFIKWAMDTKLISDVEAPIDNLREWVGWERAWCRAQSYGAEQQRQKFNQMNPPLSDEELKHLHLSSSSGKEFGRKIEEKHGIRRTR
jgi:hypothetical protein